MKRCVRTAVCITGAILAMASSASAQVQSQPFELRPELVEFVNQDMNIGQSAVARLDVPAAAGEPFSLVIPYKGSSLTLSLTPHSVRSENYKLIHQLADGSFVEVEPGPVATYRGFVEEIPGAVVAGSILEDGFEGKILMPVGQDNYVIEPLARKFDAALPGDHVIYRSAERSSDVVGECGTDEFANNDAIDGPGLAGVARGVEEITVAELACDADREYFTLLGANTEARINTLINTVNIEYERDVAITHEITAIIIRMSEPDPYSATGSLGLINQVVAEWAPARHPDITRDVVHLFTGKNVDGSVIGRAATIGGICSSVSMCFSQAEYNGIFDCASALVAHELGHVWGAFHCSCLGNTMNPFNTCENQFAQSSIDSIVSHRNSRTCLSALEPEFTSLPFNDPFPSGMIDETFWTGIDGTPEVNGDGINEPSGDSSLNISGTDELRSARLDASLQEELLLSYFVQRTGGGDSPEAGDDLVVEYFSDSSSWVEVDRYDGNGPDQTNYTFASIVLPANAQHDSLLVRFRNESGNDNFDDYFIDNVELQGNPVLPGLFALTSPFDGQTDVVSSPSFLWETSPAATTYTILVDGDPGFGSPNLNFITPFTSFDNPGFQLSDGEYFWRVTASNINGDMVSVQNPASFTVGAETTICFGDCNDNGIVNFDDLVAMLFQFGNDTGDGCDADESGNVDFNDLVATLFLFGPCS